MLERNQLHSSAFFVQLTEENIGVHVILFSTQQNDVAGSRILLHPYITSCHHGLHDLKGNVFVDVDKVSLKRLGGNWAEWLQVRVDIEF